MLALPLKKPLSCDPMSAVPSMTVKFSSGRLAVFIAETCYSTTDFVDIEMGLKDDLGSKPSDFRGAVRCPGMHAERLSAVGRLAGSES